MNLYKELEDPSIPPLSHGSAYDGYLGLKKNSRKQWGNTLLREFPLYEQK